MVLTVAFIIWLGVINISENKQFLRINISNCITMIWTVVLSFIVSKTFNQHQRKIDIIVKFIQELIVHLDYEKCCNFMLDTQKESILLRLRLLRNNVEILEQHANRFSYKKEYDFIADNLKAYDQFVSDHIHDLEYLSKSYNELKRPIQNMYTKLYELMLKLS